MLVRIRVIHDAFTVDTICRLSLMAIERLRFGDGFLLHMHVETVPCSLQANANGQTRVVYRS